MFVDLPEGKLYWVVDKAQSTHERRGSRSTLLFLHAGVADHTQWDDQASYFTARGWDVLRYDRLGFGRSIPSKTYLEQDPLPRVRHYEHAARVVAAYHASISDDTGGSTPNKVAIVGLSVGGSCAIDFTIENANLVTGLAVVAGGIWGFDAPPDPGEEQLGLEEDMLKKAKDVEGLAQLNARYWGDGPLQEEGRASAAVRNKLYDWCKDALARQLAGTGGFAIRDEVMDPPASARLSEIRVPVAVGIGKFDESSTNAAMKHLGDHVRSATVREFDAAHMVNLECPEEFNQWLEEWLNKL